MEAIIGLIVMSAVVAVMGGSTGLYLWLAKKSSKSNSATRHESLVDFEAVELNYLPGEGMASPVIVSVRSAHDN